MADPDRGVVGSKIEKKVEKIGQKAQNVFKKKPATATSSSAPATSQPQPPPVVGTGSGITPASQPNPLAESTSRPSTRPSTPAPVGQQTASTGSHDAHSVSTSNTADKAAKIPIPGGRKTPDDRLRTAILIGINYVNCTSNWKLKGCANDVVAMYKFCKKYSYQRIGVLTDDVKCMQAAHITDHDLPNVENIENGRLLMLLADSPKAGDFFFFYFAGHGHTRVIPPPATSSTSGGNQTNADPRAMIQLKLKQPKIRVPMDPYETYLIALDKDGTGVVDYTEGDFRRHYVDHFSAVKGLQFFVMVDACKCGTFIDLPFRYNPETTRIEPSRYFKLSPEQIKDNEEYYKSIKAIIFFLSATDSDQLAKETPDRRGRATKMFTDHIEPLLEQNIFEGIQLASLMDELNKYTGSQTPYLSMSKKLPTNAMINFKTNNE